MEFFGGGYGLERFLTRCLYPSLGSVPVCWCAMVFFIKEEGWHFSFLLCGFLPPVAAYLGFRGKREIRTGTAAAAAALALATLPLTFVPASLEMS
ncbi:hypothetical protein [Streptomyces glomeratus]|uniref:Glycosyltransferase RgtA/B/C/D-like domain-containing protein n=1 Tax=Streptomyces glomeratus TaxID=284452 RepID=A0ABP6M619_9ACTN|nr:hypothetical protein [Streptomyces glomeratus]MCF1511530.1 hypothetical protein [Streptomyces glomeratus]